MNVVLVRRAGALAAVLVAGAVGSAFAQQQPAAAPTKVAYVNTQAILKATPGYTAAESTFTKEVDAYRAEVSKLQATLDSSAADFEQASVMLSPTQRTTRRKDLEAQQQKLQDRTQELQQKAQARERELLDPIQQRVNAAIEAVRAEGNYAMIFDVAAPNSGILTADKTLDLTQRVVQRVQAAKN